MLRPFDSEKCIRQLGELDYVTSSQAAPEHRQRIVLAYRYSDRTRYV